jgi:hypothetical protein
MKLDSSTYQLTLFGGADPWPPYPAEDAVAPGLQAPASARAGTTVRHVRSYEWPELDLRAARAGQTDHLSVEARAPLGLSGPMRIKPFIFVTGWPAPLKRFTLDLTPEMSANDVAAAVARYFYDDDGDDVFEEERYAVTDITWFASPRRGVRVLSVYLYRPSFLMRVLPEYEQEFGPDAGVRQFADMMREAGVPRLGSDDDADDLPVM